MKDRAFTIVKCTAFKLWIIDNDGTFHWKAKQKKERCKKIKKQNTKHKENDTPEKNEKNEKTEKTEHWRPKDKYKWFMVWNFARHLQLYGEQCYYIVYYAIFTL